MSDTFPPPDPAALVGPGSAHRDESITAAFAVSIGVTALIGAACGLLWGGIGGRVAMRIVVLTSSENVRGLTSDFGIPTEQIARGADRHAARVDVGPGRRCETVRRA